MGSRRTWMVAAIVVGLIVPAASTGSATRETEEGVPPELSAISIAPKRFKAKRERPHFTRPSSTSFPAGGTRMRFTINEASAFTFKFTRVNGSRRSAAGSFKTITSGGAYKFWFYGLLGANGRLLGPGNYEMTAVAQAIDDDMKSVARKVTFTIT